MKFMYVYMKRKCHCSNSRCLWFGLMKEKPTIAEALVFGLFCLLLFCEFQVKQYLLNSLSINGIAFPRSLALGRSSPEFQLSIMVASHFGNSAWK